MKYPRTFHFPWSNGGTADDCRLTDLSNFHDKSLVYTEKLDGENCLEKNTIVTTEDGPKIIKDICEQSYGGKVLSRDIVNGKDRFNSVVGWSIFEDRGEWIEIETEDGKKIVVTGNHLVWSNDRNGYVMANELKVGEDLQIL